MANESDFMFNWAVGVVILVAVDMEYGESWVRFEMLTYGLNNVPAWTMDIVKCMFIWMGESAR